MANTGTGKTNYDSLFSSLFSDKKKTNLIILGAILFGALMTALLFSTRASEADVISFSGSGVSCTNQGGAITTETSSSNKRNLNVCQLSEGSSFTPDNFRIVPDNPDFADFNGDVVGYILLVRGYRSSETCFSIKAVGGNAVIDIDAFGDSNGTFKNVAITNDQFNEYCYQTSLHTGSNHFASIARVVSGSVRVSSATISGSNQEVPALPPEDNTDSSLIPPCVTDPILGTPIYIAPTPQGNDNNSGSIGSPVATLANAYSKTSTGGSIIFREGVYRQGEMKLGKKVHIRAHSSGPNDCEEVTLTGADVFTGWSDNDNDEIYEIDNFTKDYCIADNCFEGPRSVTEASLIDAAHQNSVFPAQMHFDGEEIEEVISLSDISGQSRKFYVDQNNNKVFTNFDPTNGIVEISVREFALKLNNGASSVSGIRIQNYASYQTPSLSPFNFAAVIIDKNADNAILKSNVITGNSTRAVFSQADAIELDNNRIIANGAQGITSTSSELLKLTNNTIKDNNAANFRVDGCAHLCQMAGVKLVKGSGLRIANNIVGDNNGAGIWMDIGIKDTVIDNNIVYNNSGNGIYYEISSGGKLLNNLLSFNKTGMKISGSHDVDIYNNTYNGNKVNLYIPDDSRTSDPNSPNYRDYCDASNTCDTKNVKVYNNLFAASSQTSYHIDILDASSTRIFTLNDMVSGMDFNSYFTPTGSSTVFSRIRDSRDNGDFNSINKIKSYGYAVNSTVYNGNNNPLFTVGTNGYSGYNGLLQETIKSIPSAYSAYFTSNTRGYSDN